MLYTLKVPSAGSWGFYVVIQRVCALEAGEEKTVLGSSFFSSPNPLSIVKSLVESAWVGRHYTSD